MKRTEPAFDRSGPAACRICVQGTRRAARLPGYKELTVSVEMDPSGYARTTLTGVLPDQARVIGLLTSLYEMGYTLLSFERIEGPP